MAPWTPYQSTDAAPWNLQRVVHLHRRAGFGATWSEIERDLADGPQAAVSRLLEGKSRLEGVPDDFESLSTVIGQAAEGLVALPLPLFASSARRTPDADVAQPLCHQQPQGQ
jgi:hypothetical protein